VVRTVKSKDYGPSQWVNRLTERRHPNAVGAALANKTTRIVWEMSKNGTDCQHNPVTGSSTASSTQGYVRHDRKVILTQF
jgi:hypothetical protein